MSRTADSADERAFTIAVRPPFRLDLTAWALRRRADNAVDRWSGYAYSRVLALDSGLAEVTAVQVGSSEQPHLHVTVAGARVSELAERQAKSVLKRVLGLEIDLTAFYRLAEGDAFLRELAARFRGLKPPRLPSLFECLVNAIACQQLTLTVGIRLLNRLAAACGPSLSDASHAFPGTSDLDSLEPEALLSLGFSRAKARSIVALAAAISSRHFLPEDVQRLDDAAALDRLLALRGIGRWSGEYALLRGLGRLHVFPGDDVGARNNLARRLGRQGQLDYAGVAEAVRPWQPFAGLVYFHLLLANLEERGLLDASEATPRAHSPSKEAPR